MAEIEILKEYLLDFSREEPEDLPATITESEESFRQLIELAGNSIAVVQDGLVKYANPHLLELLQFKKEEFLETRMEDHIPPDEVPHVLEYYFRHVCGERNLGLLDTILMTKDGVHVPVEINSSIVPYQGQPAELIIIHDLTEIKKAQKAFVESELRHRTLLESSPDSIVMMDMTGIIVYANRKSALMGGYESASEMIGMTAFDIIHPDDRERAKEGLQRILTAGELKTTEYRLLRKDGTPFPSEMTVSFVKDASGVPVGLLAISRDITERKKAEEALKISESRYRTLSEASQDVIYIISRDDTVLFINNFAAAEIGTTVDQVIGKKRNLFFPSEIADRQAMSLRKVFETGKPVRLENEAYFPDSLRWQDTFLLPLKDDKGEVAAVMGVSRDITERKAAEDALKKSEMRYRLLTENSWDVIWTVSLDGQVTYVSPSITAQSGFTPEEMLTFTIEDYVTPESVQKIYTEISRGLLSYDLNETLTLELKQYTKSGEIIDIEITTKWILDENDQPIGLQGSTRTITERKKAEAALRESQEIARTLLNASTDLTALLSVDGKILSMNQQALEFFGKKEEDIAGLTARDMFPPEIADKRFDHYKKLVEEKKSVQQILQLRNRIFEVSSTPVFSAEGEVKNIAVFSRDITEKIKAEEAIRAREEMLRATIEVSKDAIVAFDGGFTVTTFNTAAEEMLGFKREEIIGRDFTALFPPDIAEKRKSLLMNLIQKRGAKGLAETLELVLHRRNGEEFPAEISISSGIAGNSPFILNVIRDATERRRTQAELEKARDELEHQIEKRTAELRKAYESLQQQYEQRLAAEKRLIESERKLSALLGNLPGMAYRSRNDEPWTMEFISEGCVSVTGYQPNDLINNYRVAYAQLIHPDDREYVWNSIQAGMKANTPFHFMYRITAAGGEEKWVWEQGSAVRDVTGNIVAIEGFITDITDRKKAEEALRGSEERYRTLIEQAADGIFLVDLDLHFIDANTSFCRMFGYTVNEIQKKNYMDLVLKEDLDKNPMRVEELKVGRCVIIDRRMRRKDGTVISVEISAKMLNDGRLQGIVRDITERKLAEEKLRYAAIYDPLTGLYNRKHFFERLESEMRLAKRHGRNLSVCLTDLDNLKTINDEYGHRAGDEVLSKFGRLLTDELRTEDIAGRYGGDEFAIVFPNTRALEAVISLERIRRRLEKMVFGIDQSTLFAATATFGVADLAPMHQNEREFLDSADKALLQGKQAGRNTTVVYGVDEKIIPFALRE